VTTGAADSTLAKLLSDARAVYDDLLVMRDRASALRTVEEANATYRSLLAAEDREVEALQRECDAIALDHRLGPSARESAAPLVWPAPTVVRQPEVAPLASPEPPRFRPPSSDRRSIKRLVSRYQFHWQLDQSVVAQINTIVDNSERPLGEALSLLDWRVFEQAAPGESPADHERRITAWGGALDEYREWLTDEISSTETRYKSVLGIWERWTAAQSGTSGAQQWDEFIEASRAARRKKIQGLRAEIASMRGSLEGPRP
jgi:hypothetical protein